MDVIVLRPVVSCKNVFGGRAPCLLVQDWIQLGLWCSPGPPREWRPLPLHLILNTGPGRVGVYVQDLTKTFTWVHFTYSSQNPPFHLPRQLLSLQTLFKLLFKSICLGFSVRVVLLVH